MDAPRQLSPVPLRALARLCVALQCALVFGGCLIPPLPRPSRPADPEVWYELVQLDDGTQVRAGGYLTGDETRPLVEWQRPGDAAWKRFAFEPFGTARHTHFVRALGSPAGLTLLASHEGRDSLAVVQLDWDGQLRDAVEVSLGAPVRGERLGVVVGADDLVVGLSLGLPDGGGGEAGVLRLRSDGAPVRAVVLAELGSATELALHPDGALTVLGLTRVEDRLDVGVAHLSAAGQVAWARALRFTDDGYGARLPADLSLAADGQGGVLVVGSHQPAQQPRIDAVLARLHAGGALGWQRAIHRPYPETPPHWVPGPISQRAAFAPDGALFLAATAPFRQQGSSHLALLELGPGGEVLRQSAVTRSTQQLTEVSATADAVRVRGAFFFDCTFDRASLAGCEAPLALPPLLSLPTPAELRERPMEARSMATERHPVTLTPWTPPK